MELKDSGARKEFESGAVRDISEGKGRCDLLPLSVMTNILNGYLDKDSKIETSILNSIEAFKKTKNGTYLNCAIISFCEFYYGDIYTGFLKVSKHFEDGAKKYGDNNWRKGIPLHCYIDSATRHLLKFFRGDIDEPHDRAFLWNLICALWTFDVKPQLDDIENY